MRRTCPARYAFLSVFLALAGAGGCGGGTDAAPMPACGDGHLDTGEQCDDGNTSDGDGCSARCRDERYGDVLVSWGDFNADAAGRDDPKTFTSDSCIDFVPPQSTTYVRVRSTSGPMAVDRMDGCSSGQLSIARLPVGDYVFEVTMLLMGAAGNDPVTKAKMVSVVVPPGASVTVPKVTFDNGDFLTAPAGTLFFQVFLGAQSFTGTCAAASPAAALLRTTLTPQGGGAPVTQKTKAGVVLDGSAAAPCLWPSGSTDAQTAEGLPSGFYTLEVEALDASMTVVGCRIFTVFVGAGRFNPTYELVVPAGACS